MHCPSCGAISENSDCCADLGAELNRGEELAAETASPNHQLNMNSASDAQSQPRVRRSTLIEFPGVNRTPVPEWRKELSERVRELQERKARDAAHEAAESERQNAADTTVPQLELLPAAEMPAMNPLVAAALKRIERARQSSSADTRQRRNPLATAIAYAPAREENEPEILSSVIPQLGFEDVVEPQLSAETEALPHADKNHNLVVVTAVEETTRVKTKSVSASARTRLIVDDPNDPALNYLDSISRTICVDEVDTRRAAAFRRLVCAVLDLTICVLLAAPIGLAMRITGTDLLDLRAIEVLAGSLVVVVFLYLTLTTALTGRTWAMRLLSLRVIDTKTGLIPTGRQSVVRSLLFIVSLGLAGLGILFALISREGYTAHDQFTRTAVIRV